MCKDRPKFCKDLGTCLTFKGGGNSQRVKESACASLCGVWASVPVQPKLRCVHEKDKVLPLWAVSVDVFAFLHSCQVGL